MGGLVPPPLARRPLDGLHLLPERDAGPPARQTGRPPANAAAPGRLEAGPITEVTQLFGGQGTMNVNSWSPDSRRFAFVSYEAASPAKPRGGEPAPKPER